VTTSAGDTSYTEGDPATTVDGSLTVTDADDTNLEGGQVRISSGFQSGDDLVFVNQNGISGVYNTGTGVLTLSGTASVADYQTALRSIQYQTTSDDPSSPKTVEFKVNDGDVDSNLATKNVVVTGTNDAPTLNTTAAHLAYSEGDGAVAIDSGLTASDPDSANFSGATVQITSNFVQADDELAFTNTANITGAYNDSTGTLTLSGTDTVANYQAALRSVTYENVNDNPSGSKTVSFQATDAGAAASNVATRDIDLSGANDAPVVTTTPGGSIAYTEGDPATTVDGGIDVSDADDTNIESGQVRISSNFQSGDDLVFVNQNGISGVYNTGTGVLTLAGTSSVSNYETALRSIQFQTTNDNPSSSKTVEFKVNDGDVDSNAATQGINITGVNDAPTLSTTGAALSYTEGDGPVAIDSGLTASDPDSANLSGATVQITSNFVQADDELAFTNTANITGVYNDSTGTLTLSGTDTVANYQAALRSVTYENVSQNPSGSKTVSFQATDSDSAASNVATRDINLTGANDAPVVNTSAGSTAYTEGDPATTIDGALTVSDADDTNLEGGQVRISSGFQSGDDLVFVNQNGISGVYNTGTGVLTLTGTASVADYQTALRSIQFQSTQVSPVTSKTVEFKVNDGDVDSNAPTKEIAVTPVNSPPTVDATNSALSYTENDPATAVDSGLTITEPEGDNLSGGSASITANYQAGQDILSWTDNNLADNITLDNINSTQQTIVLTGVDTAANYQAALRAVTYQNGSENPSTLSRTVTFSATDTPGGATGSDTRTISVTAVDDPPDAVNDSATVLEDAGATSIPVLTNDTDIDGGPKTISSATDPANGTVVLTGGSPGAHTGLTYQPDPNYCNDPPATTLDTFQYTVNGGDSAFVSMTVTCVNDAPVADDETFNGSNSAVGNTTFVTNDPDDAAPVPADPTDTNPGTDRPNKTITGDILAGDTDVDGPGPLTVTPGTFTTNDGGSVTIEADGDFTFEPAPATSCTDTSDFFDYTVEDSGSPEQTDTGRVTVAITGCVWYVNNSDAQGNNGTSEKPFDTTQQAETASGTGHSVYVFDGNNTTLGYTTGLNMKANQQLVGQAADLVVGGDTLQQADASKRPQLTDALEDVVALDDGNTVTGIEVDPTGANSGIAGASGDTGGGTIADVRIIDTGVAATAPGLELDSTTGTFNVSNLTVDNTAPVAGQTSGSIGVRLNSAGTVNFASAGTISINTTGAKGLDATSTNMGAGSVFDDITVAASGSGGVSLSSTTGTTTLGDGSGTDLNLTTTSGAPAALNVASAGTVSVPSAGTANLHATGGPALDVTGTSGATFSLDDVDSTNSANDGINLDGLGTGTFTATSGDISGADDRSFDLNGGSGTITYPGNLGNGDGLTAIDITGRSGGAVSLSGPISDTNDAGGTINLSSNTGGSTTLNNGTKQANTGASDGVLFNSSDGHTLTLSGGGLDIDTTSGKGLEASTSGTIEVSGSGNTIDTGTGRGLNVSDTDIAAADVTFQHISSNGASNGIRLNNTGSTGNLAVTGTGSTAVGGDNSGGTIQSTTGDAVSLTTTTAPSLNDVRLQNPQLAGVKGVDVSGFTLTHSTITGAGQAANSNALAAVAFNTTAGANNNNVDDAVAIQRNTITNPYGGGVDIANYAGTISNATITENTITSTTSTATSKEDGISLALFGHASGVANLTKASINDNTIQNFPSGGGIAVQGGNTVGNAAPSGTYGTPGSLTDVVTIDDNSVQGDPATKMNGTGILVDIEGKAQGNFAVTDNTPVSNVKASGIAVGAAGSATATFVVTGNTTAPNNILGNFGISLGVDKVTLADSTVLSNPSVNAAISNNTTSNTTGNGFLGRIRDSNGTMNLRVSNNNFGNPSDTITSGLRVDSGSSGSVSFNPTVCADITGNTSGSGPVDGSGDRNAGIDLYKRSTSSSTYKFGIVGLSPSPATAAQTETFVTGLNPASTTGSGFYAGKKVAVEVGNNFTSCTLPF
jgi:hypothetical protein